MNGRKLAYEVVPESEYTDFSDREKPYVSNTVLISAATATTASVATYAVSKFYNTSQTTINHTPIAQEPTAIVEPMNVFAHTPTAFPVDMSPEMIPTGFIAEGSLNILATILDPVIQILVAISFPIASVIMVGACFFFMLGNSEKAWQMIFNAGLGYVLVQMSPLFLKILQEIGKAV